MKIITYIFGIYTIMSLLYLGYLKDVIIENQKLWVLSENIVPFNYFGKGLVVPLYMSNLYDEVSIFSYCSSALTLLFGLFAFPKSR